MRINTITCHRVDNHGANLQAYALMKYLTDLGNEVKIIDYYPEYFKHYRPFLCISEKYMRNPVLKLMYICAKFPGRTIAYIRYKKSQRRKNFIVFREKYYKLTKTYNTFTELKKNPPIADLYIAGSDQIWNTMMNNGKDPSFYLEFAPENTKRATYAASFAVKSIPDNLKTVIKDRIERIDDIAVREKSALDILEDLDIHRGIEVLDPVFLLSRKEWKTVESINSFKEKYVLVYDFERSHEVKNKAIEYARNKGYKIYSLYDNDYCDKSFEDYGPDVFLSLIRDAQFVLSNSFHATAFSIIYHKEFFVIKRQEGINSRVQDLLNNLSLESKIGFNIVDDSIDYDNVQNKLDNLIYKSKDYLERITK